MRKRAVGQIGPVAQTIMLLIAVGVASVFVMSGLAQLRRYFDVPKIVSGQRVQVVEAREMRELLKEIDGDVERTRKVVESFQPADRQPVDRQIITTDCTLPPRRYEALHVTDLAPFVQLTFPSIATRAAQYEKQVAQENPGRILLLQNLIDADQRAASRISIDHLRKHLADYQQFLLTSFDDAWKSVDPVKAWRTPTAFDRHLQLAFERSLRFYRSQFGLEAEQLDEMEAILDLIDRAREVKLDGEKFLFPTQRELDDCNRSLSRIRRLEALRTKRDSNLQQRLVKPDNRRSTTDSGPTMKPAGTWEWLLDSGARVEVDGKRILVNGKSIVLPIEKSELIAAFGQPPRETTEKDVVYCTWDELGLVAAHKPGSTSVWSVMVALNSGETTQRPKQVVRGRLTLLGVSADENSTPWSLNRKLQTRRFTARDDAGKEWTLLLEGYEVMTDFKVDGSIDLLTIHGLSKAPAKPLPASGSDY